MTLNCAQTHSHRVLISIIGAIVAMLALVCLLYFMVDNSYKQQFTKVYNEVERIRTTVIEPLGGVEWTNGTYSPKFDGDGWLSTMGCIDINCPSVSRSWLVPIANDGDDAFVSDVMSKMGYKQQNGFAGVKDNFNMSVSVKQSDSIKITDAPVVPSRMNLRLVDTSVYLRK